MASTSEEISETCQDSVLKDSSERWQANGRTVLERNKHMFNNPVMSDIKFAFPNKQTIPAHKYVLAISSPVFFAMFYGDLAEKRETVDITDCDPEVFLQFLRYLYYDDTNFGDVDRAIQVCYLADKYDVPSLKEECVDFVDQIMEPLEALDVIQHAFHLKDENLEEASWEVIDYNAQEIVADDSFLELKHEFLLSFLERSSLRIVEVTLFKAVDRWAAKRCEEANMAIDGANKRSVLGADLLKLVRFSLMLPQEFSDVVMPTQILLQTEVIDVFKQFTSVSVPGGIKPSIRPRIVTVAPMKCSMGWCNTDSSYSRGDLSLHSRIESMEKVGLLTFTVSRAIKLCGVKIISDTAGRQPSCCVSLSIHAQGSDKKIREIKDKCFRNEAQEHEKYGHIDVFFNRPFSLSKNTCYTIETKTDTTQNRNFFVWFVPESLLQTYEKRIYSLDSYKSLGISGHCSGLYTECIPTNVCYKGEIMALFLEK